MESTTTRTARMAWHGTLQEGAGRVELSSSRAGEFDVNFVRRMAEDAGGITSAEELLAAAHSVCYAMTLSIEVARSGGLPESLEVTADVSLGPDPSGGFHISGILLTVRGDVSGLNRAGFLRAARAAKDKCPVSKALSGTEITMDAALRP